MVNSQINPDRNLNALSEYMRNLRRTEQKRPLSFESQGCFLTKYKSEGTEGKGERLNGMIGLSLNGMKFCILRKSSVGLDIRCLQDSFTIKTLTKREGGRAGLDSGSRSGDWLNIKRAFLIE